MTKKVLLIIFGVISQLIFAQKSSEKPPVFTACEGKSINEKQVSDDLPLAGETKSTSKQKRLPKDQVEPKNNLSQTESNKNKEPIRDIDISFD